MNEERRFQFTCISSIQSWSRRVLQSRVPGADRRSKTMSPLSLPHGFISSRTSRDGSEQMKGDPHSHVSAASLIDYFNPASTSGIAISLPVPSPCGQMQDGGPEMAKLELLAWRQVCGCLEVLQPVANTELPSRRRSPKAEDARVRVGTCCGNGLSWFSSPHRLMW